MKILITGANGQLGNELKKIIKDGHSEIGQLEINYKISEVKGVGLPDVDISDFKTIWDLVTKYKPDIIINCAAYTNVDGCEENIDTAFKTNSVGSHVLALAAKEVDAEFIHVSTDYVFSGNTINHTPYREWDMTNPQGIYGKSKLLGEKWLSEVLPESYIVRTAWLYGYEGNNFVKTILKLAKEKNELKIVNDQFGNPTSANDLAHHILKLPFTNGYGVYHCTNEGICSWYDFAKEFVRLAGINCDIQPCTTGEFSRSAKRPKFSALDNMHLRNTVGNEMRSWQSAIKMYMENLEKQGDVL